MGRGGIILFETFSCMDINKLMDIDFDTNFEFSRCAMKIPDEKTNHFERVSLRILMAGSLAGPRPARQ